MDDYNARLVLKTQKETGNKKIYNCFISLSTSLPLLPTFFCHFFYHLYKIVVYVYIDIYREKQIYTLCIRNLSFNSNIPHLQNPIYIIHIQLDSRISFPLVYIGGKKHRNII